MGWHLKHDNDIWMNAGESFDAEIQPTYDDGEKYELSEGETLTFYLAPIGKTQAVLAKDIPIDTCLLSFAGEDTKSLKPGPYYWQARLTFTDGRSETFASGTLRLMRRIEP